MENDDRSMVYHNLQEALRLPGCPLCRLRCDSGRRFVEDLLYEGVTDPGRRMAVRKALGFCRDHSNVLLNATASLGVAIITEDVLSTLLRSMDSAQYKPRQRRDRLSSQLSADAECPACRWADEMQSHYVTELVSNLDTKDNMLTRFQSSDGLCLPHFRMAIDEVPSKEIHDLLVSTQRGIWEHLVAELGEFIRKCDHRFQHEGMGDERDSWQRAVSSLAGIPLLGS